MKMRASRAACASAEAEFLAFLHFVSLFHGKLRHVQVERKQALSVVDDDAVALEKERAREDDLSAVDGRDWCARTDAEVESLMRALDRPVEDTLHSEDIGDFSLDRSGE